MKNKKIIIPVALTALILVSGIAIYSLILKERPEPVIPEESGPIAVGDYIATDYPSELPKEA